MTGELKAFAQELHQTRDTIKRIRKSLTETRSEFNRKQLQILEYDDFINNYIDGVPQQYQESLYPFGMQNIGNTGVTEGKPLPPRKQWVDHYVTQLDSLLSMLSPEVEQLKALGSRVSAVETVDDLKSAVVQLTSLQSKLKTQTAKSAYDSEEIQQTIAAMLDETSLLDLQLKKTARLADKN